MYEAQDGEEAYALYLKKKPDIIIADIDMPKLNGLDLAKKIRQIDKNVKIIILTAHIDTAMLLKATELNLIKYLVKPITRRELNDVLSLAIDNIKKFEIVEIKENVVFNNYIWQIEQQKLFYLDTEIILTKSELNLIALLTTELNRSFSYNEITMAIWNEHDADKKDSIKTIIKSLRKKSPKNFIKNHFGIGYSIEK